MGKFYMTVNELRRNALFLAKNPYFFSPETLAFFGTKLSKCYIYRRTEVITTSTGEKVEAFCMRVNNENAPTLEQRTAYYYFDANTFERVFKEEK